jgi:hypothetical protein
VFVIALVPIVLGVLVGWGGFLGLREKLTRDRGAGVRSAATMRSEEAFRLGNKVAGLPTLAGGAIAVLAGAAGLAMPATAGLIVAAVVGVLGMLVLVAAGGVLGNRAAATVPEPEPAAPEAPAGCSGCACGTCGVFKKADTATA